jgi:hypothetical protein
MDLAPDNADHIGLYCVNDKKSQGFKRKFARGIERGNSHCLDQVLVSCPINCPLVVAAAAVVVVVVVQ